MHTMNSKVSQYRGEIVRSLNVEELVPYLCKHDLVDLQDVSLSGSIKEKNERLLALLDRKGPSAYCQFLECLDKATDHMGHAYISSLLQERKVGDTKTIEISSRLREQFKERMSELVKGIDVQTLVPYLRRDALLTNSECEALSDPHKTKSAKTLDLLNILATKGPTAHYTFACCLGEEMEHCNHWDLFQMITREERNDRFELLSLQRVKKLESDPPLRRKRKAEGVLEVRVTKRVPYLIRAQGTLISKKYFEEIRKIRRYHLDGSWTEADEVVKEDMRIDDVVFQIAIKLENCTGHITRRDRDTVLLEVGKAMQMCQSGLKSTSDNRNLLLGRCEWVLAKLYRYTGEIDKALEYIEKAAELQSGTESGEDAALTNYCHACIILERLSNPDRYSCSPDDRGKAQCLLERAIYYASNREYGLDLSHPRIRLAQLYLGSSPSQPGRIHDSDSIDKARSSLGAIRDFEKLSVRSRCIFYFTKSDLVYNCSKDDAKRYARLALSIATENNFRTEILSAQARLNRIDVQLSFGYPSIESGSVEQKASE